MGVRILQNGIASGRTLLRMTACAAGLLLTLGAYAKQTGGLSSSSRAQFERAEQLRSALAVQPETERTRRDYERVLDAYRVVYHGDPAAPKADASIQAVASLLAEEGRLFNLQKQLHDAVGEYEFLRHQYPGSRYRFSALIDEAKIYQQDLADPEQAKAKYLEFLKTYPRHPLAEEARAGLKELREPAARRLPQERAATSGLEMTPLRQQRTPAEHVVPSQPALARTPNENAAGFPDNTMKSVAASETNAAPSGLHNPGQAHSVSEDLPAPALLPAAVPGDPAPPNREHAARVTDIRYWSNASYTRIAIDLEDQVRFQAARVPNPDRIYFDLHDARLIKRLNGKAVDVTDAGFLKRIRSAQYSGDITRIVLDVSSRADYSTFFLPNPWRLIIDIHEHKAGAATIETAKSVSPPISKRPPVSHPENELEALASAPAALPPVTPRAKQAPARPSLAKPSPFVIASDDHKETAAVSSAAPETNLQTVTQTLVPSTSTSSPQLTNQTQAASQNTDRSSPRAGIHRGSATQALTSSVVGTKPENSALDDLGPDIHQSEATTEEGERSLVRTLGLKIGRIVIDAGHGGHDCGTLGPGGLQEKDITLDVALRLGKLLKQRLGADVIYTRTDDTFVPLQMRTAIANRARADLFISIHANSSSDPDARGVESYYLNFTSSPDALEVAARENAVSDGSIHELSDLVKQITLKDKIEESREFATDVQHSLYTGLEEGNPGLKDRGVKKAPFVVLIGANMPSILAEISFLTNPSDARELRQPVYRERIAESLFRGVAKYVNGLSGIRLAENRDHQPN